MVGHAFTLFRATARQEDSAPFLALYDLYEAKVMLD
jgi:hypothetical protein